MLAVPLALVLLVTWLPRCAVAGSCPGIAPETAQRLFDRVQRIALAPGYRLEGVSTDVSDVALRWSLDGMGCPPIEVHVVNCRSTFRRPRLQLDVPRELRARCPGLAPVIEELSTAVAAERPVGDRPSLPASAFPAFIAVVGSVLVAGLSIQRVLRQRIDARSAVAWIAFVLAAATPYLFDLALAVDTELGIAWIVFAVLLCDRELLMVESRARASWLLAVFASSAVLNWSLTSGGPGDLRMNLAAIWSPHVELRWGPAPIALFRLLGFVLGGIHDTGIVWCSIAMSSLVPVLLYAMASRVGVGRNAALFGAAVAAAHPLLIAFAGTMNREAEYLFAAFGSVVGVLGFLQQGRRRWFVAFVLGAVLAVTSRPEGAHVFVAYVAALLLVRADRRARASVAIALVLLAALTFAYATHALEFTAPVSTFFADPTALLWTVLLDPDFTPSGWIVVFTLGVVVALRRRPAWFVIATVVGVDLLWRWANVYPMFVGHERQVASARYEAILLAPFALGVALCADFVRAASRRTKAALLAAFVLCTAATYRRASETVLGPFTVDYEYRFLRRYAATLPSDARLYVFDSPVDDTGFVDAHMVADFVGSAARFLAWSARRCDGSLQASRAYLYIGSSCAELRDAPGRPLPSPDYRRWLQDCATMRARIGAGRVEEVEVPARNMSWHAFTQRTVRLGLYRLDDPAILCGGGGAAAEQARAAP